MTARKQGLLARFLPASVQARTAATQQSAADADYDRQPKPNRDILEMYPELGPIRRAAEAADWSTARSLVAALPSAHDRHWALDFLIPRVPGLAQMYRGEDEAIAAALEGAELIQEGWRIRGSGWGSTVGADAAGAFHDHLTRAERLFVDVLAADPTSYVAGRWRLTSGMGRSVGPNEILRRYRQLADHHPHDLAAQNSVLQCLCPKWGGTWESAEEFVRGCVSAAPGGHPNGQLVAIYHLERWPRQDGPDRDAYFKQAAVIADLVAAAEASIDHPDYRRQLGWVGVHGAFAMCFGLAREHARAAAQFEILDNFMSDTPWTGYVGDPVRLYVMQRLRAARALAQ